MAGLDHHRSPNAPLEDPQLTARNRKYGLRLFAIYLIVYAAFVLLNAIRPEWTERPALAGVNVAVVYGVGLILLAFVLAIFYGWLCGRPLPTQGKGGPS